MTPHDCLGRAQLMERNLQRFIFDSTKGAQAIWRAKR